MFMKPYRTKDTIYQSGSSQTNIREIYPDGHMELPFGLRCGICGKQRTIDWISACAECKHALDAVLDTLKYPKEKV